MSQRQESPYEFGDDLPVEAVETGTTLLVAGPSMSSAHSLGLRLLLGGAPEEGRILITTADGGAKLVSLCDDLDSGAVNDRLRLVDASGRQPDLSGWPVSARTVSSPADLTGIGIEFSGSYEDLYGEGVGRIRTGLFSVSALLARIELRTVFRFLHTVTGRIASADGFGVFVIDPTAHDEQTVATISRVFDGRIDVRGETGDSELRVRGLDDQPAEWTPF